MLRQIGHTDLAGQGEAMQAMASGRTLYVGSMKPGQGTTIVDVSDPSRPKVTGRMPAYPGTKVTKAQTCGDLLLINYEQGAAGPAERTGFGVFDISRPQAPREIAYYETGGLGVHRIWYVGERYAYLSAVPPGFSDRIFVIVDLKDPARPEEVGRWWMKGQWTEGGEKPDWPEGLKFKLHHALVHQDRAYLGYWDAGLIILDISDLSNPTFVSRTSWAPEAGGCTHTALPLPERGLLAVVDESTRELSQEPPKYLRLMDPADEKNPRELSRYRPDAGDSAWEGVRFGPHNLHENRPESFYSEQELFLTCFAGGLKRLDASDPEKPVEKDSFTPQAEAAPQLNDVFVSNDGLAYVTDRAGLGLYVIEID